MGRKRRDRLDKSSSASAGPTMSSTYTWVLTVFTALLIAVSPFFRGLFFEGEKLLAVAVSAVIFLLWFLAKIKSGGPFFHSRVEWGALGIAGAYLLSLITAATFHTAIHSVLVYLMLFFVMWSVSEGALKGDSFRKVLVHTFPTAGLGLAIVAIGAAAGYIDFKDAVMGSRLASTLQYPNTLAAYLSAVLAVTVSLWALAGVRWQKIVYGALSGIFFLVIVYTYSRGGWLVLPLIPVLLLLIAPGGNRLKVFLFSVAAFIGGLAAVPTFGRAMKGQGVGDFLAAVLIAVVITNILGAAFQAYAAQERKQKLIIAGALGGVTALMVVLGILFMITLPLKVVSPPGAPEAWMFFQDRVSLEPGADYTLTVDATSNPQGEKPFTWQVQVIGKSVSGSKNLITLRGSKTGGQERVSGEFTVPDDVEVALVRAGNQYPGNEVVFNSVTLSGPKGQREVRFYLARVLPQDLVTRLLSIDATESSVWERYYWSIDGLKIGLKSPLLGFGGGGWDGVYHRFQSFRYFSTETHNYYVQTWVESGILGLAAVGFLWVAFLGMIFRRRKAIGSEEGILLAGVSTGAIVLGVHSALDFNLSLPAVAIALWALLAIGSTIGQEETASGKRGRRRGGLPTWYLILPVITLVVALTLFVGFSQAMAGAKLLKEGQVPRAIEKFEQAVVLSPYHPDYRDQLGRLYELVGKAENDKDYLRKAAVSYKLAWDYDKYNPNRAARFGSFALAHGDREGGLGAFEKAVEYGPRLFERWEDLAAAYTAVGEALVEAGREKEAEPYLERVLRIPDEMAEIRASGQQKVPEEDKLPTNTLEICYHLGRAEALLGDFDKALDRFVEAEGFKPVDNEDRLMLALANVWKSVILDAKGDAAGAKAALDVAEELDPKALDQLEKISQIISKGK